MNDDSTMSSFPNVEGDVLNVSSSSKKKSKSSTPSSSITGKKLGEQRLVEYFIVVSYQLQMQEDGACSREEKKKVTFASTNMDMENSLEFTPVITARYPLDDYDTSPLSESVTSFCHPQGPVHLQNEPSLPKVHYFVMTGARGGLLYGTCLTIFEPYTLPFVEKKSQTDILSEDRSNTNTNSQLTSTEHFLPKCICILSVYPFLFAFREYLIQLHRLMSEGMHVPLERYISNICCEIPAPPPGSLQVQTTIGNSVIKFWSLPYNLPIPWVSLPFSHLFECLDVDNIITVWLALSLERQILVTSTQLSLLVVCCEILTSLLFPMKWSNIYIPVLPYYLVAMLSAPMPFLYGLHKDNLPEALLYLTSECIIVDLDKNKVTMGPMTPALPNIPSDYEEKLRRKLTINTESYFHEARSFTKDSELFESGVPLSSKLKEIGDAMWESKLMMYDFTSSLVFTPEYEKSNYLNGNSSHGIDFTDDSQTESNNRKSSAAKRSMKKQSNWDAVQEAFLWLYVCLLRNYRDYMVFPSKDDDVECTGSYDGAGFLSTDFVESQRFDVQEYLTQLLGTQMWDDFVTKRLYGSRSPDIIFFDNAVDRYARLHGVISDLAGHAIGNMRRFHFDFRTWSNSRSKTGAARMRTSARKERDLDEDDEDMNEEPILQSARVHRQLKTIVAPEPLNTDLPRSFGDGMVVNYGSIAVKVGNNILPPTSIQSIVDELHSPIHMNATLLAPALEKGTIRYYNKFPSALHEDLFVPARPLSPAILLEFDRQRDNTAKFRRRKMTDDESHIKQDPIISAEIATFTLFFLAYTSVVGKELLVSSKIPSVIIDSTISSTDETSDSSDSMTIVNGSVRNDNNVQSLPQTLLNGNDKMMSTTHRDKTLNRLVTPMQEQSPMYETRRLKFRHSLRSLELEEARVKAKAQLGLAFEMLDIMRKRKLKTDPEAYQCLIDACGRCGDTKRVTQLLGRMHDDGIVADGVVYSSLVSAFSNISPLNSLALENRDDLPEWANGISVNMDWNKLQRRSFARSSLNITSCNGKLPKQKKKQSMVGAIMKKMVRRSGKATESNFVDTKVGPNTNERFVTDSIMRQIVVGQNVLEMVYSGIHIYTDGECCPHCNTPISDDDVINGWSRDDPQDYTTKCPACQLRIVPQFQVKSTSSSFRGSRGSETPLLCQRLSPWVLEKELRSVMIDKEGIEDVLDPSWRVQESKNAVLWWNLILSFIRFRLPFAFLLQGSVEQNLIAPVPIPDDD